ncbi:helix-turn-helix domain-containing protein [Streptomyces sp. NBC_00444]|uniref:helix-turn-helix domain-containing protein n=1 Tax=Streptomyces sp. NBC_00444 TaxID=2975744 RepID=UPI002E1EC14B
MNHSTWRTRRARQLAGEAVEYDQEYVDARLAGDLGQAVYDRRLELGLSQAELAERAGMTQPQDWVFRPPWAWFSVSVIMQTLTPVGPVPEGTPAI